MPPSLELTAPVVLLCSPAAVPVTFTAKVQVPLGARVPPLRLMEPVACVAVIVPLPQEPVWPLGVDTMSPAGRVSVKPTPLNDCVELGFETVNVSDVAPFSGTVAAPKVLMRYGGATTVRLALAVLPVPALVEVTCTLLFLTPAVEPCTLNDSVQLLPPAIDPPERLAEEAPALIVVEPPQPLLAFGVEPTTRPAGKESVNATPVSAMLALGLVMVNVRVVVPFNGTVDAPKAFAIDGADATVRLAVAVLPVPPLVEVTAPVMLV